MFIQWKCVFSSTHRSVFFKCVWFEGNLLLPQSSGFKEVPCNTMSKSSFKRKEYSYKAYLTKYTWQKKILPYNEMKILRCQKAGFREMNFFPDCQCFIKRQMCIYLFTSITFFLLLTICSFRAMNNWLFRHLPTEIKKVLLSRSGIE